MQLDTDDATWPPTGAALLATAQMTPTILNWALACCTRLSCSDWLMLVNIPTSGLKCRTLPWRLVRKCPKLRMQHTRTTHWDTHTHTQSLMNTDSTMRRLFSLVERMSLVIWRFHQTEHLVRVCVFTSCNGLREGLWREKSRRRWARLRAGRLRMAKSSGSSSVWTKPGRSHSFSSSVTPASRPSSEGRVRHQINQLISSGI